MTKKILFVDDEQLLLSSIQRQLRGKFEVETALGGSLGLETMALRGPFAVVVSDLRMPQMDGITFLAQARKMAPETVRVMLTGQGDLDAAMAAVNQGHIFRFLAKPCLPDVLANTLDASLEQFRLIHAEKELLEKTLGGAIQVLTEVLSLVNPTAFGHSNRLKSILLELGRNVGWQNLWELELAAMLSQIGCLAVHPETMEKSLAGQALTPEEQARFAEHPQVAARLLAHIPRMEKVRSIIAGQSLQPDAAQADPEARLGSELLHLAIALDKGIQRGRKPFQIWFETRRRIPDLPSSLASVVEQLKGVDTGYLVTAVMVKELKPLMLLEEEVRAKNGLVIAPKGQEVTQVMLERLRSFAHGVGLVEPIRVRVPKNAGDMAGLSAGGPR